MTEELRQGVVDQDDEELHVDPNAEPNPDEPIEGADDLPDVVPDGDVEEDHGPGEGEDQIED